MPGAYFSRRCFLFDLDGTLVDSTPAHARAFVDALTPGRPEIAKTFNYAPFAGRPTREVFLALGLSNEPELSELVRRKQENYRSAIERGDILVFPGATLVLEQLSQKAKRLFLVTGASKISTERVLKATKLDRFFEGVTTADDAHPGKPAPEPYLFTVAKHGLEKSDCLAVEDGESGVVAAQKAGLDVVLIHTSLEIPGVQNVRDCTNFAGLLFS